MRFFALCLLGIMCIGCGDIAFLDKQPPKRESWDYSQFIQQVEKGNITEVKISRDRKVALVKLKTNHVVTVILIDDPGLIAKLASQNVDISVLP
ncbi:FtsH peptidase [Calothrix sp. NIES-4101]|nr:FtsH peptidase [Calothrix sp. NIES-4101]